SKRFPKRLVARWTRPARTWLGFARGQSSLAAADRPTTRHDLSLIDQYLFRRRLSKCDSAEEYCRTFFDFLHSRLRPARYLLEKTPTNIHNIPLIRKFFPAAKLVSIHRDGRDVVVSDNYFSALERKRSVQL